MIPVDKWNLIRPIFDNAFKSCMHFSMATVNEDGSPHLTPIGSLILREDPTGYFFDEYCTRTRDNLSRNPRVCFLAVNADRTFWVKSLIVGKFSAPPAVRLMGTVKELREATLMKSLPGTAAWHLPASLKVTKSCGAGCILSSMCNSIPLNQ
jgi:hypothetical protein